MLNKEDGIMKLRGRKLSYAQDGMAPIPCIPMLHPAYLLPNPADKAKAWDDLRAVANFCDRLGVQARPVALAPCLGYALLATPDFAVITAVAHAPGSAAWCKEVIAGNVRGAPEEMLNNMESCARH